MRTAFAGASARLERENGSARGIPGRGSVDLGCEGQLDPLQVSLLACGSGKGSDTGVRGDAHTGLPLNLLLRLPGIPLARMPVAGSRAAKPRPGTMKFRTAYSDELASGLHGIPRYAMNRQAVHFKRFGFRPNLPIPGTSGALPISWVRPFLDGPIPNVVIGMGGMERGGAPGKASTPCLSWKRRGESGRART